MRPPILGESGGAGPLATLLGVIFAGMAGLLGGIAALVAALRKPGAKTPDAAPGPPAHDGAGFVPDATTIFWDMATRLDAANEERDHLAAHVAGLEAELDGLQRRLDECNEERLTLLRHRRRGAGGSSPPASSSP